MNRRFSHTNEVLRTSRIFAVCIAPDIFNKPCGVLRTGTFRIVCIERVGSVFFFRIENAHHLGDDPGREIGVAFFIGMQAAHQAIPG